MITPPRLERSASLKQSPEQGTTLILALVFLLAIGLVIVATSTFAVNSNVNTVNTRAQQASLASVESEASAAIQAVRTSFFYPGCSSAACTTYSKSAPGTSQVCTPQSNVVSTLGVYCVGFGGSANGQAIRIVDFYVCQSGIDCGASANSSKVLLFAEVAYTDLPPAEDTASNECTATSTVTCGLTLSITTWDVRLADT